MTRDLQRQLDRIEKKQNVIIEEVKKLNELSEILLQKLANWPDLFARVKTHKGTGVHKPVPGKRTTMKERRQNIRDKFYKTGKS